MTTETTTPAKKTRKRKFTREQLITNLQLVATENEGVNIGAKHINIKGSGRPSFQAYITEFGSLNAAKVEAGLPVVGRGRPRKDAGKVDKVGEAAVAVLKAARVPLTAAQVTDQILKRDLTPIKSKNARKSVQEALHRAGVKATDGAYAL